MTRAFVERLREMGAKTAQNFGTHGKFRPEKLQNRPEVRGCVKCALGSRTDKPPSPSVRIWVGQIGDGGLSVRFWAALALARLRLGEGVGEQAGGVALGGVLLEALYQLKTRLR